MKYEGTPALWYLYLGLVDRLTGGTPWSLPIAQTPIALGLLSLIWLRSPFSLRIKLLLSLSYFISFEYGVIARSYGLGVLLLLCSVPLRKSLWGWGLLALAANVSAHSTFTALALGATYFVERRSWRGISILATGVAAAVWTALPTPSDYHLMAGAAVGPLLGRLLYMARSMSTLFVPAIPSWPAQWLTYLPWPVAVVSGLLALPIGCMMLRGASWRAGFAFLYVSLGALAVSVHEIYVRDVGFLFVFLVSGMWVSLERGWGEPKPAAVAWLCGLAVCGLPFTASASAVPFTDSRLVSAWIETHDLAGKIWGAWPRGNGVLLTTELGRATISLSNGCLQTFEHWDKPVNAPINPMRAAQRLGVRYVDASHRIPGAVELAYFPGGNGYDWPVRLFAVPRIRRRRKVPICR